MRFFGFCVLVLAVALASYAGPIEAPLVSVAYPSSGSANGGAYSPSLYTLGWSFHVNSPISITALGVFDISNPSYPIGNPRLYLWTATGDLLASTTVNSSDSPLLGVAPYQFRYRAITPVNLTAGQDYVLSAQDSYLFNYQLDITSAPEITYLASREAADGPGAIFPGSSPAVNGIFGPNALFQDTAAAVPEPHAGAGLALGLLLLYLRRRRQ